MTRLMLAAALCGAMAPSGAMAGNKTHDYPAPPADSTAQWWTGPAGCTYSRAGRGGEAVWFLTNPPGKGGCPEFIVTKPIDDAYRAPRWQNG